MLTSDELLAIKSYLYDNKDKLSQASELIRQTILRFKAQRPQSIRAAFSREPPIKTLESIVAKIEARRRDDPQFGITNMNDLVALTVLCPYETDVADFVRWMKGAFQIRNSDTDAARNTDEGHRAFHYVVSVQSTQTTFDLAAVRCELQVKTILQEAFDAKAHDLAYKKGKLKVSDEMHRQFVLLSTLLHAIDGQSEFLKDLLLSDRKAVHLRRDACIRLYLDQPVIRNMAEKLGLDVHKLPEITRLAAVLREGSVLFDISANFCKFTALCAAQCDADFIRSEARRYADLLVDRNPKEAHSYLIRSTVTWLIRHFEEAIADAIRAIEIANGAGDVKIVEQGKNNLVYFVADWKACENKERESFTNLAHTYAEEIRANPNEKSADTLGLYLIVFGQTASDVDQGRDYLRSALKRRENDPSYISFYRLHNFIALRTLLDMASLDPQV